MKGKKKSKKKRPALRLEKIIGSTCDTQYGMSVDSSSGTVAYVAGCVVVIYDYRQSTQEQFITHNNPLTCVSFSPKGSYLAVGSRGRFPEIIIYDRNFKKVQTISKNQNSHNHGVCGFSWSPDEKCLLSFGNEHDRWVKLWDVQSGNNLAGMKLTRRIHTVSYSQDGKSFSVLGEKFAKCYYMKTKNGGGVLLDGQVIELSTLVNETFVCSSSNENQELYCLTKSGILALFSTKRSKLERRLSKWVNLKSSSGHSMYVTKDEVICGCADGCIRIFLTKTLKYKTTLPTPPPVHSHITSASQTNIYNPERSSDQNCGNVVSVEYFAPGKTVSVMYSDRSFFVWDITNPKKIAKLSSFLAHNDSIWSLDLITNDDGPLRENSFCTASDDGTIRFWKIHKSDTEEYKKQKNKGRRTQRDSIASENLFCRNLLHIIKLKPVEKENGIRVIKVTPNGRHLASGDRQGNIRFHDLYRFKPLTTECAHDSEILSLDFTSLKDEAEAKKENEEEGEGEGEGDDSDNDSDENIGKECILATGSRDRHIHVFKFSEKMGCKHIKTFAKDHNSSVTSVKFSKFGTHLFSCGADRKIVFRKVFVKTDGKNGEGIEIKKYADKYIRSGKIYDMDMDQTQKYIMTCEQDKNLKIWDVEKAKITRTYKIEKKAGEPIRIRTCPSGIHSVTSSSDKILRLYDFYSGKCYSIVRGHSEVVTGLRFTNDCKRLISVGCDGLICIWRFSSKLEKNMLERIAEIREQQKKKLMKKKKKKKKKKAKAIKAPSQKTKKEPKDPKKNPPKISVVKSDDFIKKKNVKATGGERTSSPLDNIKLDDMNDPPKTSTALRSSLKEGMEKGAEMLEGIVQSSVQFRETNLPNWLKEKHLDEDEGGRNVDESVVGEGAWRIRRKDIGFNLKSLAASVRDRDPSVIVTEGELEGEGEDDDEEISNITKNSPRIESDSKNDVMYYQKEEKDVADTESQGLFSIQDQIEAEEKVDVELILEEKSPEKKEEVSSPSSSQSKYGDFQNLDDMYYKIKKNPLRQSITSHWMKRLNSKPSVSAYSSPQQQESQNPKKDVPIFLPPPPKRSEDGKKSVFKRSHIKLVELKGSSSTNQSVVIEEEEVILDKSPSLDNPQPKETQLHQPNPTTTTNPPKEPANNSSSFNGKDEEISYSERDTLEQMRKRVNVVRKSNESLLPPRLINKQKQLDVQLLKWKKLIEEKEKSKILDPSLIGDEENPEQNEKNIHDDQSPQKREVEEEEEIIIEKESKVEEAASKGEEKNEDFEEEANKTLLADDGITIIRRSTKPKEQGSVVETKKEQSKLESSVIPEEEDEKNISTTKEMVNDESPSPTKKQQEIQKVKVEVGEDENTTPMTPTISSSPKSLPRKVSLQHQNISSNDGSRTPISPTPTQFSPQKGKKLLQQEFQEQQEKNKNEQTQQRNNQHKKNEEELFNKFRLSKPVSEHKRVIESLRNSILDAVKMYQEFSEDLTRSQIFPPNHFKKKEKFKTSNDEDLDEDYEDHSEEEISQEEDEEEEEEEEEEIGEEGNMMKTILSDYESLFSQIQDKLISKKRKKRRKKRRRKKYQEEEEEEGLSPMTEEQKKEIGNPLNPTPMQTPRDFGESQKSRVMNSDTQSSSILRTSDNMMFMSMSDVQMEMEKFSSRLLQNSLKLFEQRIVDKIDKTIEEKLGKKK